jgi:murein DD-endopeptidase MepM/ murein hydrolase activator NlpD
MIQTIHRLALVVVAAATLTAMNMLLAPTSAAASSDSPADFVIKAFPHESSTVEFGDTWGASRSGGRRHAGTDIMSPKGTPVVTVEDGIVERLDWHRLSGWHIMIRHADGWTSHYLHLNNDHAGTDDGAGGPEAAFAEGLQIGDFVKAGDIIGFVGDSGNAEHTGSHTHFELHLDGTKLNPYRYLQEAFERKLRASQVGRSIR